MVIAWQDPPDSPNRAQLLSDELKGRPGEWALIDSGSVSFGPWWATLLRNVDEFESKVVRKSQDLAGALGPRDVYMRYIGHQRNDHAFDLQDTQERHPDQ